RVRDGFLGCLAPDAIRIGRLAELLPTSARTILPAIARAGRPNLPGRRARRLSKRLAGTGDRGRLDADRETAPAGHAKRWIAIAESERNCSYPERQVIGMHNRRMTLSFLILVLALTPLISACGLFGDEDENDEETAETEQTDEAPEVT